jgi:hypothetical protein
MPTRSFTHDQSYDRVDSTRLANCTRVFFNVLLSVVDQDIAARVCCEGRIARAAWRLEVAARMQHRAYTLDRELMSEVRSEGQMAFIQERRKTSTNLPKPSDRFVIVTRRKNISCDL